MTNIGYVVTETMQDVFPKLPKYPLLPEDLLVKESNGSYMKVCPGMAVGGCYLTPEQESTLVEVEYESYGLSYSYKKT